MLARPEVKRTYSRIKKDESSTVGLAPEQIDTENEEPIEIQNKIALSNFEEEFNVAKPDKLRKITDFFRIKRDSLDNQSHEQSKMATMSTCSSPITSVTNKLTQTYLDLGQKNLISVQCPECLMHYNKSFSDDLLLHKKFHSQYLKGYTFTVDPSRYRELAPPTEEILKWARFRFYAIDKFDGSVLKKMEFFLNFVHVQLGAEPLSTEEMKKQGKYSAVVAVEHDSEKISGLALFEECNKVFKSLSGCSESSIELESSSLTISSQQFIGVSRIWVDSKHRAKGIASLLLDMKSSRKRGNMAFSQPTPAGFIFAKLYQKNVEGLSGQCLIYLK